MKQKNLIIGYEEYSAAKEMQSEERELLDIALKAAQNAYAPYSNFKVGAAVRLANGEIVSASNQENAAFPSGLCAERVALFYANSKYPGVPVVEMAITAIKAGEQCELPTYPCGACRQVMAESEQLAGKPIRVIFGGRNVIQAVNSVEHLLPFVFNNL